MIPYLAVAAMPILLSFLFKDLNTNDKSKKRFLIITGIILFIFLALRDKSLGGNDPVNYYNMLKNAIECDSWKEYYNPDGVETGFQIFVYILSRIVSNPQWILVVSSAIYVICVFNFIYRNSSDVAFSAVMYITLGLMIFQMQGMRQAIAMSICILAYEFIKKNKYIPFILLVILAMQFHVSAFAFFALLLIPFLKRKVVSASVSVFLAIFMAIFSKNLVDIANDILDKDYSNTVQGGGEIATLIYVLIVAFALIFDKKLDNDKRENSFLYITIMGFACYVMRYFGAQAAERISFYFMFGQMALLPNSLECLNERERKAIKVIVYVLMIGLFAYRLNGSAFVPYKFFWS